MTDAPKPISMPSIGKILLEAAQQTDGKVERLLPLLELLNTPENERSDIGEALLAVLRQISEDLREGRKLHAQGSKVLAKTIDQQQLLQELLLQSDQRLKRVERMLVEISGILNIQVA